LHCWHALCVYLYQFSRNYFVKVARTWKQKITRNSHSRSFKVMYFGITEKLPTDCVSLYNNTGLISKVSEEIDSENAEDCRCRQPHFRLTPPSQGTSANIRMNLISPETRVTHWPTFFRWWYGSIFVQFFCDGLRRLIFSAIKCISAVQGHSSSLILAPIERAYATSYSH